MNRSLYKVFEDDLPDGDEYIAELEDFDGERIPFRYRSKYPIESEENREDLLTALRSTVGYHTTTSCHINSVHKLDI